MIQINIQSTVNYQLSTLGAYLKMNVLDGRLLELSAYSDLGACKKYFSLPGRLFEHGRLFESWALNQ